MDIFVFGMLLSAAFGIYTVMNPNGIHGA